MSGYRNIPSLNKGKQSISSSYPPSNPKSRESLRRLEGWEPNTFGDFPSSPMSSSMYNYNSTGYDATRSTVFPDNSRMGREYGKYKERSDQAMRASTEYNKARRELGTHNSKISEEGHRKLLTQSQNIINHRKE